MPRQWINSSNERVVIFHYGEVGEDGIMDDEGSVHQHPGKRPFWVASGGHSGTADSIGQAKAIVQKLVRGAK